MALNCKVGSFAKSGVTSGFPFNEAHITGLGFTPKAIILFSNGSNSGLTNIMRPGIGWTAGPTQNFCISWGSDDAIGPLSTTSPVVDTNAFRRAKNDYCFTLGSGASTTSPHMKLASFDAGGATFTYDNQNNTETYNISYLALGGADITDVKAGSFIPNATTGTQDITDVGFTPDIVFFMGANTPTPTSGTSSVPNAQWFFGAAKSATAQGVSTGLSMDGRTDRTYAARYQRADDRCIAFIEESNTTFTLDFAASYVQPLTNGFRINIVNPPAVTSQEPIFYLAIKGGSWNVGSFLQPATTGNQVITTPTPHTPKGVLLWSVAEAAITTAVVSNHHRYVFGASSSSTVGAESVTLSGGDTNNVSASTITARGTLTGAVYRSIREEEDGTLSDVTGQASLASFNTNTGFTVNWSDVLDSAGGTVARQILYVSAGDSPAVTLVKLPGTTPEVTQISEDPPLRLRALSRGATTTTGLETVNVSEGSPIIRALGKVRVVGGHIVSESTLQQPGFTEEGFVPTGYVTVVSGTITKTADFDIDDFDNDDFIVADYEVPAEGGDEIPEESVTVGETVSKKVTLDVSIITASNLLLRFSGGASYNGNSDGGISALGGAISSHAVTSGAMNSAWDDVSTAESAAGDTEVRCYYVYNNHPSLTAYDVDMWIDTNTPAGDIIEIGVGTAAVGATEATVANENTLPTDVDFSTATAPESAVHLGNIPAAGGYRSIWIKRHVPAGTPAWNDNSYTIRISFVSDHL